MCRFPVKNADVSRTQGVGHLILIFVGSSLGKGIAVPSFITVGYAKQIFRKGGLFAPPPPISSPKKAHPEKD